MKSGISGGGKTMADKLPRVARGMMDDHAADLMKAAKRLRKVKKKLDKKADDYLAGKYDPKKELRKTAVKGATTAVVMLSLLTGLAFANPAEINEDQAAANYRPAPIVMDASDFVNAPVDDDESDADEQKGTRVGVMARFRQAVLSLPQSVRLLIVTPLWALGTALMTVISFLWNILFASPLGAFIASFAIGFAVLTGLFAATAKILFPDIPLGRILSKRNVLILGALALLLSAFDAVAPVYWNSYPLAAALLKLVLGGSVIGLLTVRTRKLFDRFRFGNLPPAAA